MFRVCKIDSKLMCDEFKHTASYSELFINLISFFVF